MIILGINAYHGDAAAAIVRDGKLIAAVEEERFNRIKHCAGFPAESIRYCLRVAGIGIEDVDHVGISRDPSAHLHKKVLFAAKKFSHRVTETQRNQFRVSSSESRVKANSYADTEARRRLEEKEGELETRNSKLETSVLDGNGNGKRFFD